MPEPILRRVDVSWSVVQGRATHSERPDQHVTPRVLDISIAGRLEVVRYIGDGRLKKPRGVDCNRDCVVVVDVGFPHTMVRMLGGVAWGGAKDSRAENARCVVHTSCRVVAATVAYGRFFDRGTGVVRRARGVLLS